MTSARLTVWLRVPMVADDVSTGSGVSKKSHGLSGSRSPPSSGFAESSFTSGQRSLSSSGSQASPPSVEPSGPTPSLIHGNAAAASVFVCDALLPNGQLSDAPATPSPSSVCTLYATGLLALNVIQPIFSPHARPTKTPVSGSMLTP